MISQAKYNGFTLVEIVLVLGIFAILSTVSFSTYTQFRGRENLETATMSIVEALRHAQANAQSGKADSVWGVSIGSTVTLFKGTSFSGRDISYDQVVGLSSGVSVSGLSEITFAKVTGSPMTTGTTTLSNSFGSKNIYTNAKGTLTY